MGEISNWRKTYMTCMTNYNIKYFLGDVALNKYTYKRKYLILESQREIIQNNMEERAVNLILRMVLGDNNFCY